MMPNEPPAEGPRQGPRAQRAQPLAILDIDGGLLTLETVMALTGLRKTHIYSMMRSGTFPESFKVSARSVRWRAEEIREWIRRQG